MIKVGVCTFGADGGRSGISQYAISLLREFSDLADEGSVPVTFEVVAHPREADTFVGGRKNLHPVLVSALARPPALNVLWHNTRLPGLCRSRGFDVLFLPAANRRLPVRVPCPTVGTVHDLSILHVAGKYDALREFYITRVLPPLIRRLDRVITISRSSREDLVGHARVGEERIRVIPNGVDHAAFRPGDRAAARRRVANAYGVDGPFVLYVSRLEHPGKNHVRLIRAFDAMKTASGLPHRLVLAGSEWSGSDEIRREAAARRGSGATFTGFVAREDLPDLYRAADLFVFPSLYEGFGLPVLEAMACGTPVACAGCSSLPEVAGDAALLFDPLDERAIRASMETVLGDARLRGECIARGLSQAARFSWRQSAEQTLDVLLEAAASRRGGPAL